MILAIAILALAGFVALGPKSLTAWARGRYLIALLAMSAAGGAIYDVSRGSWLGAILLLAAAIWIGADGTAAPAPPPANPSSMSRADAAAALGVSETASREEIEAAFRRLMRRVHPDRGGAPGLAAQLNAARESLLGKRRLI